MLQRDNVLMLEDDHLYNEIKALTDLRRAFNLTTFDVMEGRLISNVTVGPALTRKLLEKFQLDDLQKLFNRGKWEWKSLNSIIFSSSEFCL